MDYTPTLWVNGDLVTADKLNKIEQGLVGKVDKVNGKTLSTNDFTDEDKAKLDGVENQINHLESLVGSPLVASTVAEMTNEDKVYVYTGAETGYQNGNWYYYNGTAWTSGGIYNSVAFETDDTLSTRGMPADAKATGDIKNAVEKISQIPTSIAYVTDGINATHYGVTYSKNSDNTLAIYGTSTGLGYFNVFNGNDDYTNGGSIAPDHNLSAGIYTVYFTGTEELKLEICYTESTYSNRTVLTSGQTLNVGANGGTIFARIYKSKDYGTEANPTLLTLDIYEGSGYVPVTTAVDSVARKRINVLANDSPYNHGAYNIYRTDFADWYSGLNADYSTYGFGHDTTYAQIVTLFDTLMSANPNYITKNAIGSGSGTGYTIYEYVFKPTEKVVSANTRKMPKILINCCVHGFEKNATFGMYCFLKDLCEKWRDNKTLETIRHFVELHVIPVSNPYGFDNDIRDNANGVNVNRNFPCNGWTADTDTGASPLDQPESAALASWISNNTDALYVFDVHTNGHYNVPSYEDANFCMTFNSINDAYFNRIFPVFVRHIERQTYKFADEFNLDMGTTLFGYVHTEDDTSGSLGTLKKYCTEYLGTLMSMTYEMFNGISIDGTTVVAVHSPQSIKMCSELLGNMLAEVLMEFSE